MKSDKLVALLIMLILPITLATASSEEYLNEFSNEGEIVLIKDYFVYEYKCPSWFNSDKHCPSTPVTYTYCSNESCNTNIIFDIQNKRFMEDDQNKELVDLSFVKSEIKNGNISKLNLDLEGFDVCSSFGSKEITKESANLAASAAESGSKLLEAEKARKVKNSITVLKAAGTIEKFNPGVLLAGIGCHYDNKKLNLAMESAVNLDIYLSNIRNNYAKEGYLINLSSQIDSSKKTLKDYLNSPVSMGRGTVNFIVNFFIAIFNIGSNGGFEQKPTEYQVVQNTESKISTYNLHIHDPSNKAILTSQNIRLNQKIDFFNKEAESFSKKYDAIKEVKPSFLKRVFTNVFMEPNYNLSEAKELLNNGLELGENAENNVKVWKLNSAIGNLSLAQPYLNKSLELYTKESAIERRLGL